MSEHFIKNIEIKNFKCFEDFKADGFGRVNLIGGKNNVGKTAFMEAVFIASFNDKLKYSMDDIVPFLAIESFRNILDINNKVHSSHFIDIFDKYDKLEIKQNNNLISFSKVKKGFEEIFFINKKETYAKREVDTYVLITQKFNNFIPSYMIGNKLIIDIFDKIKAERKREKLNQILNEFDSNILEFDIIEEKPQVFLTTIDKFHDVAELGHGLKRYMAIISSILINKDGFLFLDELENGIHYTHLDKLWEIILTISKKQNVQVFATTHSKECIESYVRVAKKLEDDNINFIELGRDKNDNLKAIVMDNKRLYRELDNGNGVRGW